MSQNGKRKKKNEKREKLKWNGLKLLVKFYGNAGVMDQVVEKSGIQKHIIEAWLEGKIDLSIEDKKKLAEVLELKANEKTIANLRKKEIEEKGRIHNIDAPPQKSFDEKYVDHVAAKIKSSKIKKKVRRCYVCSTTLAPNLKGKFCSDKHKAQYLKQKPSSGKVMDTLKFFNDKIKGGLKKNFNIEI